MGRVEAYVHDTPEIGLNRSSGIRQATYVGVWGPGSLWGLNNVMLGGWAEVSPMVSCTRCTLQNPRSMKILTRLVSLLCQATFVAASQSDLLWLDQAGLIAAMEDYPEIRPCLETIAERDKNVRGLFCTTF